MNKRIKDFLKTLPVKHRERLERIQWKIDQELNKCKTKEHRFIKMQQLFYDQLFEFQEVLNNPFAAAKKKKEQIKIGNVVEFKKNEKS